MASEKIINQKKEEVANLAAKMKEAKIILLTDYRGINVADVTELRSELRKSNSEYRVIKNNITKRALAEAGIEGLEDLLEGPTAVIMNNEDYLEAAKAIYNYSKDNDFYKIKGGVIEGKVMTAEEIITLAKLPSRETLLSMLAGALLSNISKVAVALNEVKKAGDVILFIDEIHRLSKNVEEILYPALEDFTLDIVIGKGPSAKSIRIDLPKFTLIGATTKAGSLTTPLRDRFGIIHKLELYTPEDLSTIVTRSAKILGIDIDENASYEIARRSRGTPRIANRLLKRVRDYAAVLGDGNITLKLTKMALNQLEIDDMGLDDIDRKLLEAMIIKYQGRPVGIDTLATTIGEEVSTIEDVYEPYLIQIGYIARTVRGRIALPDAYKHMGIEIKE